MPITYLKFLKFSSCIDLSVYCMCVCVCATVKIQFDKCILNHTHPPLNPYASLRVPPPPHLKILDSPPVNINGILSITQRGHLWLHQVKLSVNLFSRVVFICYKIFRGTIYQHKWYTHENNPVMTTVFQFLV